jgi:hypothetical protein
MADVTINIQAKLIWKWGKTRQGSYIAVCDSIGQTVEAERFADLVATINEALVSTFNELLSSGDLDKFLQDRGWSCPNQPTLSARRNVRFDVPFDLKGVQRRDLEAAFC